MLYNLLCFWVLSAIFLLNYSNGSEKQVKSSCEEKYSQVKKCVGTQNKYGIDLLNLVKENKDAQAKSLYRQYEDSLMACSRRTEELSLCCEQEPEMCRLFDQQMALFENNANTLDKEMTAIRDKTFTNFFA